MANEAKTEHVVPGTLDPKRTLRILVAEDNRINRQVVGWMLEPLDAQIDMVENGLEAVAAVARSPYDLVLMDIQMPEMDGVTATQEIRAMADQAASLPIIALTANAMQGDREAYLAAGMSGYVAKPIDQRDLLNTITGFAGVAMPDMAESARPAAAPQNYPPAPETSRKVKDLAAELDNLLDGTHC